jgi:hypothetical protein
MSTLQRYIELTAKLHEWRKSHPEDTPEEDSILDEMEFVWRDLTDEEQAAFEAQALIDHRSSE